VFGRILHIFDLGLRQDDGDGGAVFSVDMGARVTDW
jgi:hypothetical protein